MPADMVAGRLAVGVEGWKAEGRSSVGSQEEGEGIRGRGNGASAGALGERNVRTKSEGTVRDGGHRVERYTFSSIVGSPFEQEAENRRKDRGADDGPD